MGLVRKVDNDSVAAGNDGGVDMSSIIRQAVAAEIERQRQDSLTKDGDRDADRPGEAP